MRERGLQQAEDPLQVIGSDQRDILQLDRTREQVESGGVLGHRSFEQMEIESADILHDVQDRVIGDGVEEHVGVPQ